MGRAVGPGGCAVIPFPNHPCTSSASLAVHSYCLRLAFASTNDLEMELRPGRPFPGYFSRVDFRTRFCLGEVGIQDGWRDMNMRDRLNPDEFEPVIHIGGGKVRSETRSHCRVVHAAGV